jgi:hypothetical protein
MIVKFATIIPVFIDIQWICRNYDSMTVYIAN